MLWVIIAAALSLASARESAGERYAFYCDVRAAGGPGGAGGAGGGRRVFGGEPAGAGAFPAAGRLADRAGRTRCSAAVLAPRWALTAAHCVSANVAYVHYEARRTGDYAAVHSLYRHPEYEVIHEDEGRGMDVTLLHHDVGLVRTRTDMILATPPDADPLIFMRKYNTVDLESEEVEVLGFGRTEAAAGGERLFSARLRLAACGRAGWLHCACGAAPDHARARGVCSGDSGGPVLYRGRQVGLTSLGPVSCASAQPAAAASSVFTALHYYVDVVNGTLRGAAAEPGPRMALFSAGCELHYFAVLLVAPFTILFPVIADFAIPFAR